VGRGIALLFHDRGTRRGWVVSSTPRRTLSPGKTRYPFYRRLDGPQGRSGRAENLVSTGDSIPDRPARSQSLYRLSYRAHAVKESYSKKRQWGKLWNRGESDWRQFEIWKKMDRIKKNESRFVLRITIFPVKNPRVYGFMSVDIRHDILRKAYSATYILNIKTSFWVLSVVKYVPIAVDVLCLACLIYEVQGDWLFFMLLFHLCSDT